MYKVVGVVPFVLWKYIETKVVGFENGFETMKYQLLPSKRVQVDYEERWNWWEWSFPKTLEEN